MAKKRLDKLIFENQLASSREQAQALIMAGKVRVNDVVISKSGKLFDENAQIEVTQKEHPFVSRGGVKLQHAIEEFDINPNSLRAMDVGASTGGFTHCLLLAGADHIYAVDVGYGQLAWELANSPKVTSLERTNIRHLKPETIGEMVDIIVIDASFISLSLIFPNLKQFLKPNGTILALIKPQFEAGKSQVGRKGKIKDGSVHQKVIEQVKSDAIYEGFEFIEWIASPIYGKKSGNKEFFIHLKYT